MSLSLIIQLVVVLAAIALGARAGGVGMGLWGGVGLAILVFIFGEAPGNIPGEVLLIILTVIMAASAMEAAGGIDYLVRIASGIIRKSPKNVTLVAPVVAYIFTFLAGTGHIFYPLLPVIYEVAMKGRVRPERPIAVSTIASQQAITASPVSAATAALIALLGPKGIGLGQILMICIPSTLIGVIVAALVQTRVGVELDKDPEYLRRVAAGEVEGPDVAQAVGGKSEIEPAKLPPRAALSAGMFLVGVLIIVCFGLFPSLRAVRAVAQAPLPVPAQSHPTHVDSTSQPVGLDAESEDPATRAATATAPQTIAATEVATTAASKPAKPKMVSMPMTIAIVMLALAALMLLVTGAPVGQIVKTKTCQAGITAVIGILGLAWMGDTFIQANYDTIMNGLTEMATKYPASFSIGLFVTSMLLYSQAATTQTLVPLGIKLGIPAAVLAGMFPAVNGYFFIPTYGTLIAAVNFDRSGTTRVGKYVLNHSFMIPGIISTIVAVTTGITIGKIFF